jgi:hypothetical protein
VTEFAKLFPTLTFSAIALGVIAYVLMYPDRAQKVAGFIWAGIARVFGAADRKAVAHLVQGDVNTARAELMKDAPEGVLDSKLKVKWTKPEDAQALMREGDVVVFMKKARHREENLANAVMAYLPRAVLPRARRYIDRETMRAVDLTLARSILQVSHMPTGVLDVFFEKHLDPVLAEESGLRERLDEVDAIDIHGWLTRVMLNEYRIMGEKLYPGDCDEVCLRDARSFCDWLGKLARRKPYDYTTPLKYRGRFLSAGIVFVALKGRVETEGIEPYRKKAKRLVYQERCDSVFLMARDQNIPYVKELRDTLATDARIESIETYEYALRSDFAARFMQRERGIIVVLRRRRAGDEPPPDEDADVVEADDEIEVYDFEVEEAAAAEHTEERGPVEAPA